MKKVLSLALVAAMGLSLLVSAPAEAKSKLKTKSLKLKVGQTATIKINKTKKAKYTFKSSKKAVASVSSKGKVKAVKVGKANITVYEKLKKKKKLGVVKVTVSKKAKVDTTKKTTTDPTKVPTATATPTSAPTAEPTAVPTAVPTAEPTLDPAVFVYEGLVKDGPMKTRVESLDPKKPTIAFTFDDGPEKIADASGSATSGMIIQNALKEAGYSATFNYVMDPNLDDDQVAEIMSAFNNGFEVANHSVDFSSVSYNKKKGTPKIEEARARLEALVGYKEFTFRPPNLSYSTLIDNIDVPIISCTLDSGDYNGISAEAIINKVKQAKDGDVILMHSRRLTAPGTQTAVPELIKYFKEKGWQVVSVVELFKLRNKPLYRGKAIDSNSGGAPYIGSEN